MEWFSRYTTNVNILMNGHGHWYLCFFFQVFDARDINTPSEMYEAICKHIKYGTNKGNLR